MSGLSVHAVIVAYDAPGEVTRCLAGLERQVPVLIVDNSSSKAVASIAARYGATYVDAGMNRGFAAAVNMALVRLAEVDEDVLLINPDAVVRPGTINELARFLARPEHARVAAVAPRLSDPTGLEQRVIWPFPTPGRMWAEAVGLGRLRARRTFVVGAVLLLRRAAVDEVGMFDERFFLYAEESDWQRRALDYGWTSAVCVDAIAEHTGAGTSTDSRRRETLFHAAQEIYIRKWHGAAGWWLYRVGACFAAAARTVVLTRGRREEAARRTLLYLRGPCRCAGLKPE